MIILKVIFYIWHSHYISGLVTEKVLASQAPICSLLIYNPERRQEAWRFLTYQFVHVNMEHIVFNTLMQLVVGLPLEMSQPGYRGTLKVVVVYLAGVVFGSVGGSLPSPTSYLGKASFDSYHCPLSLVEAQRGSALIKSFIVLLRQCLLYHKEQARFICCFFMAAYRGGPH